MLIPLAKPRRSIVPPDGLPPVEPVNPIAVIAAWNFAVKVAPGIIVASITVVPFPRVSLVDGIIKSAVGANRPVKLS
jgi:hypothetical protein